MSFEADAFKSFSFVMLAILVVHALLERSEKVERFVEEAAEEVAEVVEKAPPENFKVQQATEEEKDFLYEFAIAEDKKNKIKKEEPAAFQASNGGGYGGFAAA